jgi:hypothetical protein
VLRAANRYVDAAHSPLMIDGRVLVNERVERGFATVECGPLVGTGQKVNASLIHGTLEIGVRDKVASFGTGGFSAVATTSASSLSERRTEQVASGA